MPSPPRLELVTVCGRPEGDLVMLVRDHNARTGDPWFPLYTSRDGAAWEVWREGTTALRSALRGTALLPCALDCEREARGWMSLFCLTGRGDPNQHELWRLLWLKSGTWSKSTARPAADIHRGGAVRSVALAALGESRLLCGLIEPTGRDGAWTGVFRLSRDERSWRAPGPPDFVFPTDGGTPRVAPPGVALLPGADGTRLFYEFRGPGGAVEIHAAFCPRSDDRSAR